MQTHLLAAVQAVGDLDPAERSGETSGGVPDTSAVPDRDRRTGTTLLPSPGEADPAGPLDPSDPLDAVEERRGELILGSYETISRTVDTDAGELTLTAAVPVDQLAGTVDTLRRGLVVGLPAIADEVVASRRRAASGAR